MSPWGPCFIMRIRSLGSWYIYQYVLVLIFASYLSLCIDPDWVQKAVLFQNKKTYLSKEQQAPIYPMVFCPKKTLETASEL